MTATAIAESVDLITFFINSVLCRQRREKTMARKRLFYLSGVAWGAMSLVSSARAQTPQDVSSPAAAGAAIAADRSGAAAAADSSASSLARHDFLYAGEAKNRRIFLVEKGKISWTYDDPTGMGEISDAVMLSNRTILLAHQFAVKLIDQNRKVLWSQEAPTGAEIHTAVPIGLDHVLYVQNGDPALVRVVNVRTGETKVEFRLPVGNAKSVHGQFRHARINAAGELLVAHMDLQKVCAYDATGKERWTIAAPGVWGVEPLESGNVLISGKQGVREVNRRGETVWQFTPTNAPQFDVASVQLAWRLPNGNTLINNWFNEWNGAVDLAAGGPLQAIEVTPDNQVAWELRSWTTPNLGPATTIQILDQPSAAEHVAFGGIR